MSDQLNRKNDEMIKYMQQRILIIIKKLRFYTRDENIEIDSLCDRNINEIMRGFKSSGQLLLRD